MVQRPDNPEPPESGSAVVVFLFSLARTGVAANAVRLANALSARGHRVRLLVCREEGQGEHVIDPAVQVDVVAGLLGRWRLPRPLALAAAIPAIHRRLRRLHPDIMLSAGNHGHLAALLASAGISGLRRVLRISNDLDHPGDGLPVRLVRRLAHRLMIRAAHRLLLVSAHLARHPLLAPELGGRAVVTPNGVAVEEVLRRSRQPCPHEWIGGAVPVVVAVGRLVRQKNFATLILAVARASRERPMRLLIVGAGSARERRRLQELAARCGIGGQVQLTGEMANPMPFLAGASVFALPSLWEGASNVLLEALACGVPLVASRSAGSAQEVLGYGRFGLLVEPLDVEGLAQALLYQTAPDACRPAGRAADFSAPHMLARACAAVAGRDSAPVVLPQQLPWARRS